MINSFLFMLIGLELQEISLERVGEMWLALIAAIAAVQIARALTTYSLMGLERKLRTHPMPKSWSHVLYWGGLKGSIPLALVVGLPQEFVYRESFLVAWSKSMSILRARWAPRSDAVAMAVDMTILFSTAMVATRIKQLP